MIRRLGVLVLLVLTLAACSSTSKTSGPAKYQQTWKTPYSSTTCADWRSKMTDGQRWAAAADMLAAARQKDGAKALPPDAMVDSFAAGLTRVCEPIATLTLTDAGVGLYLTDRRLFAP